MNEIKKQWQSLKDKSTKLYQEARLIMEEQEKVNLEVKKKAVEYCLKEGLLSKISWAFDEGHYKGVRLIAKVNKSRDQVYKEISELFEVDYHCQTMLSFDAEIQFNDGELSLNFKSVEDLHKFCLENHIKVKVGNIYKTIKDKKQQINSSLQSISQMEDFLSQVKQISDPEEKT